MEQVTKWEMAQVRVVEVCRLVVAKKGFNT